MQKIRQVSICFLMSMIMLLPYMGLFLVKEIANRLLPKKLASLILTAVLIVVLAARIFVALVEV